jgi:iron complex transport system ATP-binding protein
MNPPFFEIANANVWRGEVLALHDLSLCLGTDENVAILGGNGAGKSSLLKLMTGEVRSEARANSYCKLFGEEQWCLEELRHRLGLVMPEEVSRFLKDEVAADVVRSAFRGAYGRTGDMRFKTEEKAMASQAMESVGVGHLSQRHFGQLSSGEKRRFLIARALVHRPEILVLDEPSTALDFAARIAMLGRLQSIAQSTGTLVLVTHDPGEILPEIDRVILLKAGRVIADGEKREVLSSKTLSGLYEKKLKLTWSKGWAMVRPER